MDREIEDALRRVCEPLGIDLAVLWQWSSATPGVISPTHVYAQRRPCNLPSRLQQEHFPWYRGQMLAGRVVAVSSLEEFPAEAAVDREYLPSSYGIKSQSVPPALGGGRAARRRPGLQRPAGSSATGRTRS